MTECDVFDTVSTGTTTPLMTASSIRFLRVDLPAGESLAPHGGKDEVFFYVLSGSGTLVAGTQKAALKPGRLIHLPPGPKHEVRALSDLKMLVGIVGG